MVNVYVYSYCCKNFTLLNPLGAVCPNVTNPENGQVVQVLDGNIPGTLANYSCNAGYTLFGNVSRECISTGVQVLWTGEAPTCQQSKSVKIHVVSIHILHIVGYSAGANFTGPKFCKNAVSALE